MLGMKFCRRLLVYCVCCLPRAPVLCTRWRGCCSCRCSCCVMPDLLLLLLLPLHDADCFVCMAASPQGHPAAAGAAAGGSSSAGGGSEELGPR